MNERQLTYLSEAVSKPWGAYLTLDDYDSLSVKTKLIKVDPHKKLSLQSHDHRIERWVVLHGNGQLVYGTSKHTLRMEPLKPMDSFLIAEGELHRLINNTNEPLFIFEVQIGSRCDEGDITRYEDDFGRVTP